VTATDVGIISVVSVTVIAGLFRGLAREIFSLLSVIVGLVAASTLYTTLAPSLLPRLSSQAVANAASFAFIFFAAALAISLLGKTAQRFIQVLRLRFIDRILGAFFGLLKGIFITTVIVVSLVTFVPPAHPFLENSRLSPFLVALGKASLSVISDKFKKLMEEKADGVFRHQRIPAEIQGAPGDRNCLLIRRNNSFSFFRIRFA
jgi:membrane protein required for colicin V production